MVAPVSIEPSHVRWSEPKPQLDGPTLIAAFEGWNDAGDAATTAASHLADRWGCEPVAEIDPEPFFDFTASRPMVRLDDGKARHITWPANEVRVARLADPAIDAVVLIGTEPQLRWRTFSEQLVTLAASLGVKRVVTLGALLAEVPHSRDVEVYGSAEDTELRAELDLTPSGYEGPTGIVGVLSSAFMTAGYPTASFWSAVPSYMPAAPSPKAALALVKRVCTVMRAPVSVSDLEQRAEAYEREITRIVAEDDETAEYVGRLEKAWDASRERARPKAPLRDDPDRLVAEVEQFLRDSG
ncbi:MAG: PAC2 family protein [Acidimicrobiaceae bacterium]|nr:PAC2 family protein [Acidimicrobiaceae bacterium]